MTQKRNLVVVRTGAQSLHRKWLGAGANWDLAISSYASDDRTLQPEAKYFHFFKGGKWDGLAQFFATFPDALENYDYVWLPDDDIDTRVDAINNIFDAMPQYGFGVMQPALSARSFFWHPITLHCALTQVRFTNFVEVMVPVLAASMLKELLPVFATTKSGWGVDWLWADMARARGLRSGILDKVQVLHTRPVGSALAKEMKSQGLTGVSELSATGYENARALCTEAIMTNGLHLRGQALCGLVQFASYAPWTSKGRHKRKGSRVFLGSLYSHLTKRHPQKESAL